MQFQLNILTGLCFLTWKSDSEVQTGRMIKYSQQNGKKKTTFKKRSKWIFTGFLGRRELSECKTNDSF